MPLIDTEGGTTRIRDRIGGGRLAFNCLVCTMLVVLLLSVLLLPLLIHFFGNDPVTLGPVLGCVAAAAAIAALIWPFRDDLLELLTYEHRVVVDATARVVSVEFRNVLLSQKRLIPFAEIQRVTVRPVLDYGEGTTLAPVAVLVLEGGEEVPLHLRGRGGSSETKADEQARAAERVARKAEQDLGLR